jgi:hypothetical protein
MFAFVEKRLVDDAVVAKKEVLVAFVLVELPVILKLPIFVDEPVEINPPPKVERPDTESVPSVPILVSDVKLVTPGIT